VRADLTRPDLNAGRDTGERVVDGGGDLVGDLELCSIKTPSLFFESLGTEPALVEFYRLSI
jgi:hypothetical protein